MDIAIVHPFDPWGEKAGGVETLVRLMLAHAPQNANVSVIGVSEDVSARPCERWLALDWNGRPISFYGLFHEGDANRRKRVPLSFRFAWALRSVRFEMNDALCIYHRPEPLAMGRIQGRRNVLAFHSDPNQWVSAASEVKWKHAPWLYRLVEARAVAKADALLGVNAVCVETLQERYPRRAGDIRRVPTTYRDDIFSPILSQQREDLRSRLAGEYQLNPNAKWVLFAGRLEAQKDPLLALESFARAKQSAQDVALQLIIIGQGSLVDALKRKAFEMKISDSVFLLGTQRQPCVADWMRAADVFLMTSAFEGFPIALLEAYACGLAAVASDAGDVSEVLQHGKSGEVVYQQNADDYAAALLRVLAMERESTAAQCVAAVGPYRPESVIQQWLQI
ncbi:MAG: glycosyltransferase family 4 protein [Candidatus Hinthialibacter antarcticus]|nr:glycosyltransferase family 4 protein [Candidatus Hinthialibacter antarcticus]